MASAKVLIEAKYNLDFLKIEVEETLSSKAGSSFTKTGFLLQLISGSEISYYLSKIRIGKII